jgi:hypothetical protein
VLKYEAMLDEHLTVQILYIYIYIYIYLYRNSLCARLVLGANGREYLIYSNYIDKIY